jgi:hypothetical protein
MHHPHIIHDTSHSRYTTAPSNVPRILPPVTKYRAKRVFDGRHVFNGIALQHAG